MVKKLTKKSLANVSTIAKEGSKNVLNFIVYITLILILLVVNFSVFSSLPQKLNVVFTIAILVLIIFLVSFALYMAIKKPHSVLFSETSVFLSIREGLFDDLNQKPYHSDDLSQLVTHAPVDPNANILIETPGKVTKIIDKA